MIIVGGLVGTRSLPSFCGGGPLLFGSIPEREQGCYNIEKPIFLLVVGGREGWKSWLCKGSSSTRLYTSVNSFR